MDAESVSNVDDDAKVLLVSQQTAGQRVSDGALHIHSLRWGVTVNIGNYESVRLDAEAAVPTGGNPVSTLAELQRWMDEHAPASQRDRARFAEGRQQLTKEIADLQWLAERAEDNWRKMVRFLEDNHLPVPQTMIEDLPF